MDIMKKKILLSAWFLMCIASLAACKGGENSVTKEPTTEEPSIPVKEEMEAVEQKSLEFENGNWDIAQQEMNAKESQWFALWDEELNSLWERLDNHLSGDKKDEVTKDQLAWIERKEKNVIAAGYEAYGGTMQPLLESSKAMEMTRARAYALAELLAEALGEDYTMPAEIKESLPEVDVELDSVFEFFRGSYTPSEDMFVKVNALEESPFSPDEFETGTKWVMWYTHSDVLTEADVYAYTKDRIIFEKEGVYYVLERSFEGNTIFLSAGSNLLNMENVCTIEF